MFANSDKLRVDRSLVGMTEADITVFLPGTDAFSFPDHRKLTRLYCMNGGYHLQILPDGTVTGTRDEDNYSILRIKATSPGVVVIEGTEAGHYLSMNVDGKLYASSLVTDESYFLERMEENHYNTYQSQKHGENWYVGIKKNGKMKHGQRTHTGQKAIFFLPRQVDQEKN
ncbi:putative fibroblast growth factor 1 isoform X2 [Myxocyprinus asiaticus]|uniref:putative fibroblast growth factor 1 isoform X2 n=1 Tax=Myxocyprinus asiaticus TaxID=70543 RepID=UPI0022219A4C|nr:putative fibroblast growth factor 1 isoform X2 [Myxocyprinus asiaticus]